jgi:nucleotidyltransferase/DNA polymerase involved in DNA repair
MEPERGGAGTLGPDRVRSPPPAWILYVDLDAYYVACELRDRPDLVGRPVIVGPPPASGANRGVVLSASYEARAFGVRSALPVRLAARLCPEAVWIPPDFGKYERLAEAVRAILRRYSAEVRPYSIDEASLVLREADEASATGLARTIQRELRAELALTASIGISTSRVVAKMASDRAKPGGILAVPPERIAAFVAPLPVRSVPGVGPRTEERLARREIRTVGDLASIRPSDLVRDLGGFARYLGDLARGTPHEEEEEAADGGPRSRSADRTLPRDLERWEELEPAVRELARRLGEGLDREGLRFGGAGVAFKWADFDRSQRTRALAAAAEGPEALAEAVVRLARGLWEEERAGRQRPVRMISVRAERLQERRRGQVSLDRFVNAGPDAPRRG